MNTILQYSIERSGSTLVTQMLMKLFPTIKIRKTHTFNDNINYPIVSTYRDFRDVMVSQWRVSEDISLEDLDNGRIMCADEVKKFLKILISRIDEFNHMYEVYNTNLIVLQYEKFINNYDYIFDELECFFNTTFDAQLRHEIIQYTNLDINIERAQKFKSFHNKNWDKTTLIHGLHIYKRGQPGVWKQLVPSDQYEYVNSYLKKYLIQWGYEV